MEEIKNWFIAKNNIAEGPYSENELRTLYKEGKIEIDTYVVNNLTMNEWKKYSECMTILTLPKIPQGVGTPNNSEPELEKTIIMPPVFRKQTTVSNEPEKSMFLTADEQQIISKDAGEILPPKKTASLAETNTIEKKSKEIPIQKKTVSMPELKKPNKPQKPKTVNTAISVNTEQLTKKIQQKKLNTNIGTGAIDLDQHTLIIICVVAITLILMFVPFFKVGTSFDSDNYNATLFETGELFTELGHYAEDSTITVIGAIPIIATLFHVGAVVLFIFNKKNRYFCTTMETATCILILLYWYIMNSIIKELYSILTISITFTGILCLAGWISLLFLYSYDNKHITKVK